MELALALLLTLSFWVTPALAAAPDQQEDICTNPAVIFCENFEDRSTSNIMDLSRPKYKNNGWGVSQTANNAIVTSDRFDGTKSLMFTYPQGYNTGAGFFDSQWGGSYRTLYMRVYTKWSSNYVISGSSTKHLEFSAPTSGAFNGIWINAFGNRAFAMNIAGFPGVTLYLMDQNGSPPAIQVPTDNAWHCFEVRWTQNSGASTRDGAVEGWVDGVQKWSYTSVVTDPNMPNNLWGLMLSSYWNCALGDEVGGQCAQQVSQNFHPQMFRWHDNIVVSTQRIGCLGGAPPPPSNTQPNAPLTPTLSGLRQWLASLVGGMWPAVTRLATITLGWSQ